jgi:sec-independent protein translocase protein TatC
MAAASLPDEFKMTLMEHLTELRARLLRITVATLVLGGASLVFAREVYGLLMRPVLDALPPDASALVYTSAIEELNVLMKIGLYTGLFLSTPVLLHQLWAFVAPGLYETERKMAMPFIVTGTFAFLAGAAFCYLVLLPSMFRFLLQNEDTMATEARLGAASQREQEAVRYLRLGDVTRAAALARTAIFELSGSGPGERGGTEGWSSIRIRTRPSVDVNSRLDGLGRLVDAVHDGLGSASAPVLTAVMDKRLEAMTALAQSDHGRALLLVDEAAAQLAAVAPDRAGDLAELWRLERLLGAGRASMASANWTRPMLSMSEQLTLVLVLELAFGLIFELPLVMMLLGMVGLVSSKFLFRYQRHAFVVCLIAAALITPTGDAVNLALMAGPMLFCYELGVLLVWLVEKRRKKQDARVATPTP